MSAREPVTTTYLELTDPAQLRPARAPRLRGVAVARVDPPDGMLNRRLYRDVGSTWSWTDHAGRDACWWQAHAETVETWVLRVDGETAGYAELERDEAAGSVEIVHFGLLSAFHGRGLGGHLLTVALRRALELAPRVWLHTCTLDGPAALPNYQARGLRVFRTEVGGI